MAEKEQKLTLKQSLFVEAYLGVAKGNATEAARIAGYKGNDKQLGVIGAQNLAKLSIAARISQRVTEAAMGADEVLKLLSDHARASMEDFLTFPDDGSGRAPFADLSKAKKLNKLHLLKKLDAHELTGTVKSIQLHDAQSALALLGKYHKLFTDQVEHSVSLEAKVIRVPQKAQTPEQWEQEQKAQKSE